MVKRKIIETAKEYDAEGRVIKETITETTEDDDTNYVPYYPTYPVYPTAPEPWKPCWYYNPTTTSDGATAEGVSK
jgi:hypothetical protein